MTEPHEDPAWHVIEEAASYLYPAALRAAVLLDVADHLVDGSRDPDELATLTGARGPYLRRLLRYLASRGTFREDDDGRFHLTPYADVLRADSPRSVRAGVLTSTSPQWWASGGDLVDAVRHGEPAFDRRYGQPVFAFLAENPDMGALFNQGMANFSAGHIEVIAATYDFPASGVLVDVGGGVGGLLLAVLGARPGLHGVLLDHEKVLADNVLDQLDTPDRYTLAPGDFFSSVPAGDLYALKNILHNWTDDECVRILENCRRAMKPGGKVLIMEMVIPAGNDEHFSKTLDMIMMALLPGQERTVAEYERLLDRAGLRVTKMIPTATTISMIEAEPR